MSSSPGRIAHFVSTQHGGTIRSNVGLRQSFAKGSVNYLIEMMINVSYGLGDDTSVLHQYIQCIYQNFVICFKRFFNGGRLDVVFIAIDWVIQCTVDHIEELTAVLRKIGHFVVGKIYEIVIQIRRSEYFRCLQYSSKLQKNRLFKLFGHG